MSTKKSIGIKGKVIHSQAREVIASVLQFMKEEAEHGLKIPLTNFKERLIAATNISESTYRKIKTEADNILTGKTTSFTSPRKSRPRSNPKSDLNEGQIEAVRSIIHNFYIMEKRRPTLKGELLQQNIN